MFIEVENLTVSLNRKTILKDISFQIQPNQFVAVIGANGSGKSTLLKSIYKLIQPSVGTIAVNKRPLQQMSYADLAKEMAVVGQFNSTELDYAVLEFVSMGRYPHKKKYARMNHQDMEIVLEALDFMDMRGYKDRKIASFSGGEKQRVVIARALAQQPSCLILDEPTNHLDIKYQLQLLKKLRALPITVLMSIHDISFAYNFFEHIIALKNGELLKAGPPELVITEELVQEMFDIQVQLLHATGTNKVSVLYTDD